MKKYKNYIEFLARRLHNFAFYSRLFVILMQAFFNIIVPDHDAGVFLSPTDASYNSTVSGSIADMFLHGLSNWDGQYFLHISEYGYTHENCLAFFPLLPSLMRLLAWTCFFPLQSFLHYRIVLTISGVVLNVVLFGKAAKTLFYLTFLIFGREDMAVVSTLLFCINPASIFFSALYTESLFAYLTFKMMLHYQKGYMLYSTMYLSVSAAARSNGLVNIGFLLYGIIREWVENKSMTLCEGIKNTLKNVLLLIPYLPMAFMGFSLFQWYTYTMYCTPNKMATEPWIYLRTKIPEHVYAYIVARSLKTPSHLPPSWCFKTFPISYNYVQTQYWNVGFLNYYEWKQLPNFVLAAPAVVLVVSFAWKYFQLQWKLMFSDDDLHSYNRSVLGKEKLLPYVVHSVVLTAFGVLCIHVQVLTRMLCSASPMLYWIGARGLTAEGPPPPKDKIQANMTNWISWIKLRSRGPGSAIIKYFVAYFFVGTLFFSNFLPWT